MARLRVSDEVRAAAEGRRAIVALETAVLTHGLPQAPMGPPPCCSELLAGTRAWESSAPAHVELMLSMAAIVRREGAVPAAIGVLRGEIVVGLADEEIRELGRAPSPVKLSARDLSVACALRESGGTTVAGTLAAMAIANVSLPEPIRVFATGGIGGVHRGWTARPDISADLLALAGTPACVVSAGAKSILDLEATLEALDTLGIPVLGLATDWFPRFITAGAPPLAVQRRVGSVGEAATICLEHWRGLGLRSGVLLANAPPERWALDLDEVESIIARSVRELDDRAIRQAAITPYLLRELARATGGRSVHANVAALLNNALVGARLAGQLERQGTSVP